MQKKKDFYFKSSLFRTDFKFGLALNWEHTEEYVTSITSKL